MATVADVNSGRKSFHLADLLKQEKRGNNLANYPDQVVHVSAVGTDTVKITLDETGEEMEVTATKRTLDMLRRLVAIAQAQSGGESFVITGTVKVGQRGATLE